MSKFKKRKQINLSNPEDSFVQFISRNHITWNHRVAEVGRDLQVYEVQPLFKQGYLQQGAQNHVQMDFEDRQPLWVISPGQIWHAYVCRKKGM